jgi:hypothetical protein
MLRWAILRLGISHVGRAQESDGAISSRRLVRVSPNLTRKPFLYSDFRPIIPSFGPAHYFGQVAGQELGNLFGRPADELIQ